MMTHESPDKNTDCNIATLSPIAEGDVLRKNSLAEDAKNTINKEELHQILEGVVAKVFEDNGWKVDATTAMNTAFAKPPSAKGGGDVDDGLEEKHQPPSHNVVQHQFSFVGHGISSIECSFDKMRRDGVQYPNDEWGEVRNFFVNHKVYDLICFYSKDGHRYLWELFRKRPPRDIVERILKHWPVSNNFPAIKNCVDEGGMTILHHAITTGASYDVVKAIVAKDPGSVGVKDKAGKYPLTVACVFASKNGLEESSQLIIKLLFDNGRALSHQVPPVLATIDFDDVSDDVLLEMILKPGGPQIGTRRDQVTGLLPVQIAILKENRSGDIVAFFMKDDRFTLRHMPVLMLDRLAQSAATSTKLQEIINDATCRRWEIFMLFLELYCHVALVVSFIYAAERFALYEGKSIEANLAVVALSTYFAIREVYQVNFHRFTYFFDIWNWIDLIRIFLSLASAVCLFRAEGAMMLHDEVRFLLLTTGAFVVAGLVLFLRSIFLPFAEFVGGLIAILTTLGPFVFVSFLVVFSFAFMYFMIEIGTDVCRFPSNDIDGEEPPFCTLKQAILTTFNFFYSGPDQTSSFAMDVLFGLVAVVILLNVVIAIVSDAWEGSKKKIGVIFWGYKIDFLAEVESLSSWSFFGNDNKELPILLHGGVSLENVEVTPESNYTHCYQEEERNLVDDLLKLEKDIEGFQKRKSKYLNAIKGYTQLREKEGTTRTIGASEVEELDYGLDDIYRSFRRRLDMIEEGMSPVVSDRWESDTKERILHDHETISRKLDSVYHQICEDVSTLERIVREAQLMRSPTFWTRIDNLGRFVLRDKINWNAKPYIKWVKTAEDYYMWVSDSRHPRPDRMSLKEYSALCTAGSWERNWYWACTYDMTKKGKPSYNLVKTRTTVAIEFCKYLITIVLGAFTFGAFWPESTRKYLFAVSTEDKLASLNEELEKNKRNLLKNTDYLAVESMTETEARLLSLEDHFNTMSLKLDAILNIVADS